MPPSRNGDPGWSDRAGADSRLSLLRELGEQAVLETIFRRGPITRPEIAAATELSKPTVSAAVSRLEQSGLFARPPAGAPASAGAIRSHTWSAPKSALSSAATSAAAMSGSPRPTCSASRSAI